jgi:hypothetical protein
MKFYPSTILIPLLISSVAFAQSDKYSYKRKLNKVEKEDYYAIPILPEVLARCKSNLNDIRLYNFKENDTSEVPYIMEWLGTKNEQTAIPFELINDTYNEKRCSYVTLKFTKKQTINQIVLNISDANFDKNVKLEGSNDNKNWFTIKEHLRIVRFNNSDDHFEYTTLDFQNTEFTYFRLKFDDNPNSRITVTNAYAYENKASQGSYCELKMNKWIQKENKKEKTSEIIIDLPYMYMVNYITLKSNSKNDFYRNINVYGSNGVLHTPKGDKENWYLLNTSVLTSIENNPIRLNNEAIQKLKIEIINYDNEPIEINDIKAFGEQCRLVASLPASDNMYLAYGKSNDNGATYDLEHFKTKIPKNLTEINYGIEQVKTITIEKPNALIQNKKWLWIAMGVVILLIGYFALSMLKKEQE